MYKKLITMTDISMLTLDGFLDMCARLRQEEELRNRLVQEALARYGSDGGRYERLCENAFANSIHKPSRALADAYDLADDVIHLMASSTRYVKGYYPPNNAIKLHFKEFINDIPHKAHELKFTNVLQQLVLHPLYFKQLYCEHGDNAFDMI